ncbi:MAG: hypothetical protein CL878_07105, partial [Dehalococcoidia bacterium]|nr:hypothetical protein [Dehalococcoidia bacterium]
MPTAPAGPTREGSMTVSETPTAPDSPGTVIGIDLGGTKVLAAVVAPDGRILSRDKASSRGTSSYEELLARIADTARAAASAAGVELDSVVGVGIGVPGTVDQDAGIVRIAPNLDWRDVPVSSTLSDLLGLPVIADNDVNVAALAEHRLGTGKGLPSLLGVFIGTGIGGGLAIDGGLHRGAHQAAAEIGHMVIKAGGPRCPCGRRGCLEALGSRTAISREIARQVAAGRSSRLVKLAGGDVRNAKGGALRKAYAGGDKLTRRVVDASARYVGIGVGSLVNVVDPAIVAL